MAGEGGGRGCSRPPPPSERRPQIGHRLRGHGTSRCPLRQGTRPDVPHRLQPGERRPVGLPERDQRSPYRRRQGGASHRSQLCRGVLAEGLTCEWIDERRSPQTRIQADVLSRLAELQERDDPEAALDVLERIIVLNPDPEEAWRRIIRLRLRLNRRDQARNTATLLRGRLQELGVRPTRETERLFSEL
ncbi:bacterial transcriptional activator domain-containing protein [Streptosporangium sp. NPDC020072]|uniref:bacterial transcriptional activator domain-containing protein n=1 Tax=Streptosporangium sp. NPDC020072 TaxID=3154788 RepID=UPI003424B49A